MPNDDATIVAGPPEDDLQILQEHLKPKYSVEKKLGSGGMADVYLGFHNQLKRKVAIKVLPRMFARDESMVQRFLQEAESAAQLDHPNIISIYDIGVAGALNFFIMAFVPGGSLKERLKESKKLQVEAASRIIVQMCSALQYAHNKGVIHRDIKPDNIMFDEHDNAILMDFGIAKAKFASKMTATGTLIGTPHYMSPEQLKGKELDGRSDIYSLGIMFYEILTGKVPFEGEDTYSVGLKHIQEPPVPPLELNAEIPEQLNNVILAMLAKVPEGRFQTSAEVANAVAAAMRGEEYDPGSSKKLSDKAKAAVDTWRGSKKKVEEDFREMDKTLGGDRKIKPEPPPGPKKTEPQKTVVSRTVARDSEKKRTGKSPLPMILTIAAIVVVVVGGIFALTQLGGSGTSGGTGGERGKGNGETTYSPETLFEDYKLIFLTSGSSGLDILRLEKDDEEEAKRYFEQRPEIGQTAVDVAYNPRSDRFLIEQRGGSLMSVNSQGFDEVTMELATSSGDWPKMASWNTDGTKAVYVRKRGSEFQLVIAEINDIGLTEQTYIPYNTQEAIFHPQFLVGEEINIVFGLMNPQDQSTRVVRFREGADDVETLFSLSGLLQDLAIARDTDHIACLVGGSNDERLMVWNADKKELEELKSSDSFSGTIAFTPDGAYVVYGIKDGSDYIFAAINYKTGDEYEFDAEWNSPVYPVQWLK